MVAKVRCSRCRLEHEPKADALCPRCGTPVTVEMRDGGPWTAKPARAALDEAEEKLAALKRRRSGTPWWVDRRAGAGVIIGALVALWVLRRLVDLYLRSR